MSAIDQAIRDRAIQTLDLSIALSAGAGSGKTSVLTRRIIELLLRGTPARRIAAITFTEKAAGELQARVRDAFEGRIAAGQPVPPGLLEDLALVTLSTIHGFCHHLLTIEAFDAAWAPDTEVLPDILAASEVQEAYREWEAGFRHRHRAAGLVIHQLVTPWTLRSGAMRVLGYRDLRPLGSVVAFDPDSAHEKLIRFGAQLWNASMFCTAQQQDKLLLATRGLLAVLLDASNRPPTEAVVRVLASKEGLRGSQRLGRKADWRGNGKQLFVAALQRFREWRAAQLERLHGLVIRDLTEHFLPTIERAKASAAVADYDDLLFRAARLLRERAQARARLAGRFDAVLIDEVQDTDPIQAEVAALLTRDPAATGEWNAHPPRRGRLFAVGDPRQSIYRFRRADELTWQQLQELLERDGEGLSLSENFRSVPGIVAWVNATFRDLPGYQPQRAHREPGVLAPVVRLPVAPGAGDLAELGLVTRYLLALAREGTVVDAETKQRRPLAWSDVMLLLPSWAKADELQSTLTRAGIPAVIEGGGTFFTRDEIRLAIAALRCLDEPGDEHSAVLVLRGLFGLTWNELARHRGAGGAWRFTVPNPPAGPVADDFALLRRLARQRGRRSWVLLLDELLEHSRAAAVWSLLRDGPGRLANLDKLRALLRQLEARARSPAEVLRLLDELDKEQDLSRVDADHQAVRITSYFKAKGLEAPVVVLCFARRRAEGVQVAVDRRARQVVVKLGALRPVDWQIYEDQERSANESERRRWMYVAATRARDQLAIVDCDRSTLIREHLANGLAAALTVDPETLPAPEWRDQTFAGLDGSVDTWLATPPDPDPRGDPGPTREWSDAARESIRAAKRSSVRWQTVHELAARERVSGASSAVGTRGGTLVHQVMEALDLGQPLELQRRHAETLIPAFAAELGLPDARARVCLEIVHRMLEHPALDAARAAPERWVEVPFSYRDDAKGRVVSGRIDLAFPTDERREHWYIVDWKSDLPPRDSPGWRNYQNQLGHYAEAVLEIVPACKRTTTVLVGPHPELEAELSVVERLAERHPELAVSLEARLEQGLPEPRVECEVEGVGVELAWDEQKVVLCGDNSREEVEELRAKGWRVIEVDWGVGGGGEGALEEIAGAFG